MIEMITLMDFRSLVQQNKMIYYQAKYEYKIKVKNISTG